jgi:hypothetical protein
MYPIVTATAISAAMIPTIKFCYWQPQPVLAGTFPYAYRRGFISVNVVSTETLS